MDSDFSITVDRNDPANSQPTKAGCGIIPNNIKCGDKILPDLKLSSNILEAVRMEKLAILDSLFSKHNIVKYNFPYRESLIQLSSDIFYELLTHRIEKHIEFFRAYVLKFNKYIYRRSLHLLVLKLHENNLLDLLLDNSWIILVTDYVDICDDGFVVGNSTTSFVLENPSEIAMYEVMHFIIEQHKSFDIKHIWIHIKIFFQKSSPYSISILKQCYHLPDISDNILDIYYDCKNSSIIGNILEMIEDLMICGIFKPSACHTAKIFVNRRTELLELFANYNINARELLKQSETDNDNLNRKEFVNIFTKLGLTLEDYLKMDEITLGP